MFKVGIWLLILWSLIGEIKADEIGNSKFDPRTYMYGDYVCDFETTFSSGLNRNNFALVRKYLEDKNEIEILIQELVLEYGHKIQQTDLDLFDHFINLKKELKRFKPDESIVLNILMNKPFACYWGTYKVRDIQEQILPRLYNQFCEMQKTDSCNQVIYSQLMYNLKMVSRDKWQTEYMVNDLLEPDMRQQNFRIMVSFGFMILIGTLLVIFFFVIYKKSNNSVSSLLLGGSGLQFVTIFVLIISIIIFGILGVIGGTELAAILSGISGYVLGKTIKEDKEKKEVL